MNFFATPVKSSKLNAQAASAAAVAAFFQGVALIFTMVGW